MTVGIYKLKFNNTDKVYIGKSKNIERRFKEHLLSFKNNDAPRKLLIGFIKYGIPTLEIIIKCAEINLSDLEEEAIKRLNTVNNGFNTRETSAGITGLFGEEHGSSKFTNKQIIDTFNLLIDSPEKSAKEISSITKVSLDTVKHISSSSKHIWLEREYPDRYAVLRQQKGMRYKGSTAKDKGISYLPLLSPTGEVFNNIDNVRAFARRHSLDNSAIGKVLNGKIDKYKGWTLF